MADNLDPTLDPRFSRDHEEFVNHYQDVLRQLREANPPIEEPDDLSKLEGSLEFLLVKAGCEVMYDLQVDNGWMVPLIYQQIPRPFKKSKREFTVYLMSDTDLHFILLLFTDQKYVIFGCDKNSVPFTDEIAEHNLRRLAIVSNHIFLHYTSKITLENVLPSISSHAKKLVTTDLNFCDGEININIPRCAFYDRFGAGNFAWSPATRLFRVIIFLLQDIGAIINLPNDAPEINEYDGSVIPMKYITNQYYIGIVQGYESYLFTMKNEDRELISANRIPFRFVPKFGVFPAIINRDNNRFQALYTYLHSIMVDALKSKSRHPSLSRTSSMSDDSFNESVNSQQQSDCEL